MQKLARLPAVADAAAEIAAALAACYPKSAGSSNVPVDYTLRRYVKKSGGAKPGFVACTRQRTLFVTPGEEAIAQIKRV
jgi:predicted ribosome quality control (RQC) complex YloA/Tae2 family protein